MGTGTKLSLDPNISLTALGSGTSRQLGQIHKRDQICMDENSASILVPVFIFELLYFVGNPLPNTGFF